MKNKVARFERKGLAFLCAIAMAAVAGLTLGSCDNGTTNDDIGYVKITVANDNIPTITSFQVYQGNEVSKNLLKTKNGVNISSGGSSTLPETVHLAFIDGVAHYEVRATTTVGTQYSSWQDVAKNTVFDPKKGIIVHLNTSHLD